MEKNIYQVIFYENDVLTSQHRFNTIDDINTICENFPTESFKKALKNNIAYIYVYQIGGKHMIILNEKNKHLFEIEMDGDDSKLGSMVKNHHKEYIRREKLSHLIKNI